MTVLGKGKKEDWPDEQSDEELKMEPLEDEEEIAIPVVKSKGIYFVRIIVKYDLIMVQFKLQKNT